MKILMMIMLGALAAWPVHAEDRMPMECQLLPVHVSNNDVAYKPGVDVKGKPVVPADLNAPMMELPQTIVIPLTINMADRLKTNNIEGLNLESPLGMVEIFPNGRVVYNDQDLTPQVYALCGRETVPELPPVPADPNKEAAATKSAPSDAVKAPDGQVPADTIKSDAVEIAPTQAVPPEGVMIEGGESRQEGY